MNPMQLASPSISTLNQIVGNPKIQQRHLQRLAYVYVRQSSLQQLNHNKESTQNQYHLVHRAKILGWPHDRIFVIDEDLGKSGQYAENRSGFQKLLTELALDHKARKIKDHSDQWVIWANEDELQKLKGLLNRQSTKERKDNYETR